MIDLPQDIWLKIILYCPDSLIPLSKVNEKMRRVFFGQKAALCTFYYRFLEAQTLLYGPEKGTIQLQFQCLENGGIDCKPLQMMNEVVVTKNLILIKPTVESTMDLFCGTKPLLKKIYLVTNVENPHLKLMIKLAEKLANQKFYQMNGSYWDVLWEILETR